MLLALLAVAAIVGFSALTMQAFWAAARAQDQFARTTALEVSVQDVALAMREAHAHPVVRAGRVVLPDRQRRELASALRRVAEGVPADDRARLEAAGQAYLREVDRQLDALREGPVPDTRADEVVATPLRVALVDQIIALAEASHARADRATTRGRLVALSVVPLATLAVAVTMWRLGRLREVRARARATAEMRASHEALVEKASDLIVITDERGTIRYRSPAALTVLGHLPASGSAAMLSLVHDDDADHVEAALRAALVEPGRTERVGARARHRDGTDRTLDVQITNLLEDPRVGGLVWNCRDETDRSALEAELEHQAFHDTLTGLPNRALFHDRLGLALARTGRHRGPTAVLLLDLDGFKAVNDSLGHDAGDRVLIEAAGRFAACVRTGDTVARLGGDEFAVLLEEVAEESAARELGARILEVMGEPFAVADQQVRLGVSGGLVFSFDGLDDAMVLVRNADIALYRAKERGRGCVVTFETSMHEAAQERLSLAVDLDGAVDRGELAVVFQPTVDLATGDITGVEALARWHHPTRGLVPPLAFIPLAEANGEIMRIGRWVLEEACRSVMGWRTLAGAAPLRSLCVNLSPRQLADPGIVDDVRDVLEATALDPAMLVLEITESALTEDPDVTIGRLRRLKDLGIRLAIDDFGTGYSSLSHLRRFPVDIIKIDRSFVEASTSTTGAALVRGIVDMATALELGTVAEGIEDLQQAERMHGVGCLTGQGYLYARPMPSDELGNLLASGLAPGASLAVAPARG